MALLNKLRLSALHLPSSTYSFFTPRVTCQQSIKYPDGYNLPPPRVAYRGDPDNMDFTKGSRRWLNAARTEPRVVELVLCRVPVLPWRRTQRKAHSETPLRCVMELLAALDSTPFELRPRTGEHVLTMNICVRSLCTGLLCRRGHAYQVQILLSQSPQVLCRPRHLYQSPQDSPALNPPPTAGAARVRRAPEGFPTERSPGGGAQFRVEGFRGGFRGRRREVLRSSRNWGPGKVCPPRQRFGRVIHAAETL